MPLVWLRFHAELEDFLPASSRGRAVKMTFRGPQTVKHLVEAAGVPHVEVGEVRRGLQQVAWDAVPADGNRLDVFPRLPRARWLAEDDAPRFALDGHLGKLASYLRLLGFDTWYRNQVDDAGLAVVAASEGRVVLTRDRDLLKRKAVAYGYWVRALVPRQQVAEVLDALEPLTRRYYDEFYRCDRCGQIYWRGSHFERITALVDGWLASKEE